MSKKEKLEQLLNNYSNIQIAVKSKEEIEAELQSAASQSSSAEEEH